MFLFFLLLLLLTYFKYPTADATANAKINGLLGLESDQIDFVIFYVFETFAVIYWYGAVIISVIVQRHLVFM